jgi:Flp pilus assembly protein TadD
MVHLYRGDAGPGIPAIETALRLSPNDWRVCGWLSTLSGCHYVVRDYAKAAAVARLAVQREPTYPVAWRVLAIALGQLGQASEARAAMERFIELMPSFTTEQKARTMVPHRDESDVEQWIDGLRMAGWKG